MEWEANSNSNGIFIVPNLHLKTHSRRIKQKKQKTIIINLRHSKGQCNGEKPGKAEVRVDMLVLRDHKANHSKSLEHRKQS